MLMQGVIEQNPLASGTRRNSLANTERVLETNLENLLRMVCCCYKTSSSGIAADILLTKFIFHFTG